MDWALVVSPMNGVLNGWTPASLPPAWTSVRNRWELGHAVQAALFAVGFVCLEIGAVQDDARSRRSPVSFQLRDPIRQRSVLSD
jgi:hypothetical protein